MDFWKIDRIIMMAPLDAKVAKARATVAELQKVATGEGKSAELFAAEQALDLVTECAELAAQAIAESESGAKAAWQLCYSLLRCPLNSRNRRILWCKSIQPREYHS